MNMTWHQKLLPGYAESSSRRHPKESTTIIVGEEECSKAVCVGSAVIDGSPQWMAFKIPGQKRYFFQYRP